ncbi:hypothetical protein IH781_00150 [Patescibacteria group bacterium]|nr:hypothetical protein [Patescibacteria group bacterium]
MDAVEHFVDQHWKAGVTPWPIYDKDHVGAVLIIVDESQQAADTDLLHTGHQLLNGQAAEVNRWISNRVPLVIMHRAAQRDHQLEALEQQHQQVRYEIFKGVGWYDIVYHALYSIQACYRDNLPTQIALTLSEHQAHQRVHALAVQ